MQPVHKNIERDYLRVYQEVTRLIALPHDPVQVMELVVQKVPPLLEVDAATIRLLDESTNSFILGAACGLSDDYLSRQTIDSAEVMEELRQGYPIARTGVDFAGNSDKSLSAQREGIRSVLSLPILYQEKVIGIMRLLTRKTRDFTSDEINFAMSVAEQVGIAITKSSLLQEKESQLIFFEELREISRLVNSTLDLDKVLQSIVEKLPAIMGVKGCTIRLLDPATNRLELAAAFGLSDQYLSRGSIGREESFFRALDGEPVAIYDATTDVRVGYHEAIVNEGIKSILVIPIRNEQEIIGVMRLLTDRHHIFNPSEINFAVTAAEEGGGAIQRAKTYRKITLLFNHIEEQERFLQTIMDSLWLSVLVLDADRRVVMANRTFLDMQQLSEAEILGRNYDSVSPWHGENSGDDPVGQVFDAGASVAVLDELETESGTCWFERHLTPIIGDNGKTEYVIEAVRDITDQKLLDHEKVTRAKLQGVVEMAGTVAHQLNSPLFAALGTAQMVLDELSDQEIINDLNLIIRNLQSIAELTRKMTTVTGFKSREYVGETRIIDIQSDT